MYYKALFDGDLDGQKKLDVVEELFDLLDEAAGEGIRYIAEWKLGGDIDVYVKGISVDLNRNYRLETGAHIEYDFDTQWAVVTCVKDSQVRRIRTEDISKVVNLARALVLGEKEAV